MKRVTLSALVALLLAHTTAAFTKRRQTVAAVVDDHDHGIKLSPSPSFLGRTLAAPRGGDDGGLLGTPITKANLVAFFVVFETIIGALLPSPNKVGDLFGWSPNPNFDPGSVGDFSLEFLASSGLGIAVMTYLSNFNSDLDSTKIVAFGSLGCFFVNYKAFLNDTFRNLGCPSGFGLVTLALFVGMFAAVYGVLDFEPDTVALLTKIFCAPIALTGIIGCFSPDMAKSMLGFKDTTLTKGAVESSFRWMCRYFAVWGFIAISLLADQDAMTTTGRALVILALMNADSGFLTKDVEGTGMADGQIGGLAVVLGLIGLTILIG